MIKNKLIAKAQTIATIGLVMLSSNSCANYIEQLTCLADNVYFEARGESKEGWSAVTNVVFNRIDSDKFPNTACQVIKQRRGNVCQFSWTCKPINAVNYRNTKLYKTIRTHVHNMYKDRKNVIDNTDGALFYHSTNITVNDLGLIKHVKRTKQIGNHIFYNIN